MCVNGRLRTKKAVQGVVAFLRKGHSECQTADINKGLWRIFLFPLVQEKLKQKELDHHALPCCSSLPPAFSVSFFDQTIRKRISSTWRPTKSLSLTTWLQVTALLSHWDPIEQVRHLVFCRFPFPTPSPLLPSLPSASSLSWHPLSQMWIVYSLNTSADMPGNQLGSGIGEWNCSSFQWGCAVTPITHGKFSVSTACVVPTKSPWVSLLTLSAASSSLSTTQLFLVYLLDVQASALSMSLELDFLLLSPACIFTVKFLNLHPNFCLQSIWF